MPSQIPTRLGSTYSHTPDAFPHTFWQIPIGRPSPHTIYKLFKIGFSFDETSGSSSTNPQPTLSSKHPGPALLYGKPSANRFKQMLQTCEWGVPAPPARTAMVTLARVCAYLHVRLCARARAHLHGQGHACTAMCISSRAYLHGHGARRDQRPAHTDQAPTQLTQVPCGCVTSPRIYASNRPTQNTWGAWASTATAASMSTTGGASTCVGPA